MLLMIMIEAWVGKRLKLMHKRLSRQRVKNL